MFNRNLLLSYISYLIYKFLIFSIMTVNELINQYPSNNIIEDGYASPPLIYQSPEETGAWVRGMRPEKSGIWFMVNQEMNSQVIYPGNVILVDREREFTRRMIEIPFSSVERKSLRLDAKYSNEVGNSTEVISNFTRADVKHFVDACLTKYKDGSHDLGSNTQWQYESTDRKEGIALGGSIKGVEFTGTACKKNQTITVAYLKQEMYTVSLNNEYSTPSDIFTDRVDVEKFKYNISTNRGTPAIIDAVKYGRIIAIWAVQEGKDPITLGVDNSFKLSIGNAKKSAKFYLRVYGGIAGKDKFVMSDGSAEEIKEILPNMKEVGKEAMETAMPMEYSVKFLRNMAANVMWKDLPYYKAYIPQIKFKVTESNKGADEKAKIHYLDYIMYGNDNDYCRKEVDLGWLDGKFFYCSPKSLCIDIMIGLRWPGDARDFNIMLPCIPYDFISGPNDDGEWEFEVHMSGNTVHDAKQFSCKPSVAGAVLSKKDKYYMKAYGDSPLSRFSGVGASEEVILQEYINWMNSFTGKKDVEYTTDINNIHDLRPYFTANPPTPVTPDPPTPVTPDPPTPVTPDPPTPVTPPEPKKPGDLIVFKHVGASDNQMEYTIIDDNSVSFHERIVSKNLNKIISKRPDVNFSHYRGQVEILEKVKCQDKIYNVVQLGSRANYKGAFYQALEVNKVSVPGTVTVLFNKTFYNCVNLTSVILHEGLKEIEGDCFFKCLQLSSITIPDSVSTIGKCAFNQCVNLAEVTIGKNINNLDGTFLSCKLLRKVTCRAITPPNILINPFEEETYHFGELLVPYQSLEQYKNHPAWGKFNKISYYDTPSKSETPDSPTPDAPKYLIINDGNNDIKYEKISDNEVRLVRRGGLLMPPQIKKYIGKDEPNCSAYHGTIVIPERVTDVNGAIGPKGRVYTVTKLGSESVKEFGAFVLAKDLQEVSVPGTVRVLYNNTFNGCTNLHKVTLNEGIEEISSKSMSAVYHNMGGAFTFCQKLQDITLPDSLTIIGNKAFDGCISLTEITLGKNIESLSGSFRGCPNIRKVTCRAVEPPELKNTFEEGVVSNAELFVPGASLEKYKSAPIWQNFKKISYYDNPPTTETPPTIETPPIQETPKIENFVVDGIRYWVKDANAKVVYITDKLQGKYKDSIAIPQMVLHEGVIYQVLKIGNNAFKECTDLYAVNIPNTIKGVNDYAFADTPQLRSIHCYATTPPEVKPKGFDKVLFDKITLYVPKDTVSAYKSAEGWKNFVNILPLDS